WDVSPPIVVDVLSRLVVHAHSERPRPSECRQKRFQIAAASGGGVCQYRRLRLRALGHDVENPTERGASVQRGCGALDEFDSLKVQGRCLKKPKVIWFRAEKREPVGQYERVPRRHAA